jgi:hypothetical protein
MITINLINKKNDFIKLIITIKLIVFKGGKLTRLNLEFTKQSKVHIQSNFPSSFSCAPVSNTHLTI